LRDLTGQIASRPANLDASLSRADPVAKIRKLTFEPLSFELLHAAIVQFS